MLFSHLIIDDDNSISAYYHTVQPIPVRTAARPTQGSAQKSAKMELSLCSATKEILSDADTHAAIRFTAQQPVLLCSEAG